MATIIAIGSIVICFICLYYLISLWKKVKMLNEKLEHLNQFEQEIGSLLLAYIDEMKIENGRLLHSINDIGDTYKSNENKTKNSHLFVSKNEVNHAYGNKSSIPDKVEKNSFDELLQSELKKEHESKDMIEHAFEMRENGATTEEIASFFHKGKTEMELLLKFREKIKA